MEPTAIVFDPLVISWLNTFPVLFTPFRESSRVLFIKSCKYLYREVCEEESSGNCLDGR
jgi:hypothetical protein